MYPELKNVTCLAHAVHNLAETVKEISPGVNEIITIFCKIFGRYARSKDELKTSINTTIPSFPVLTRWGTWVNFLSQHFDIPIFIKKLETQGCAVLETAKIVEDLAKTRKDPLLITRFASIISRNPDYGFFKTFNAITCKFEDNAMIIRL